MPRVFHRSDFQFEIPIILRSFQQVIVWLLIHETQNYYFYEFKSFPPVKNEVFSLYIFMEFLWLIKSAIK